MLILINLFFYFNLKNSQYPKGVWQTPRYDFIQNVYRVGANGKLIPLKKEYNFSNNPGFRYDNEVKKATFIVELVKLDSDTHEILPQVVRVPTNELDGTGGYNRTEQIDNPVRLVFNIRPKNISLKAQNTSHRANTLEDIVLDCPDCKNTYNIGYAAIEITDANDKNNISKPIYLDDGANILDGKSTASIKLVNSKFTLPKVGLPIITAAKIRMFDTSYKNKNCKDFNEKVLGDKTNEIDPKDGKIYCQMPYIFYAGNDFLYYHFTTSDIRLYFNQYYNKFESGLDNITPFSGTKNGTNIKNANPLIIKFAYKSTEDVLYNLSSFIEHSYNLNVFFKNSDGFLDKDKDGNYLGEFVKITSPNFINNPSYAKPNYSKNPDGSVNISGCIKYDYKTKDAMNIANQISDLIGKKNVFYYDFKTCGNYSSKPVGKHLTPVSLQEFEHLYYMPNWAVNYYLVAFKDDVSYKVRKEKVKESRLYANLADCKTTLQNCQNCGFKETQSITKLSDIVRNKVFNLGELYSNITVELAYPKIDEKNHFLKLKDFTFKINSFQIKHALGSIRDIKGLERIYPFSQTGVYFKDANCYEKGGDVYKCKLMDLDKSNVYYYKNGKLEALNPCVYPFFGKNACYDKDYYRAKIEKLDNYSTTYLDGKVIKDGDALFYETTNNYEFIKDVIYFKDLDANGKMLDKDLDSHVYSPEYYFSVIFKRHCDKAKGCLDAK